MYYTSPQLNLTDKIKKTCITSAVAFALSTLTVCAAGEVIDKEFLKNDQDNGELDKYRTDIIKSDVFDSIYLPDFTPPSSRDQYAIHVMKGAEVTITGNTYIDSYTNWSRGVAEGTLALTAGNKFDGTTGVIRLLGDVELYVVHDIDASYGANAVYSIMDGSLVELGSENTKTVIWSIAEKPDAISAKLGAEVKFSSKRNQLVGNIDTIDEDLGTKGSTVTATFSGKDSYWFGDEQTFQNFSKITVSVNGRDVPIEIKNKDDLNKLFKGVYDSLWLEDVSDVDKETYSTFIKQMVKTLGLQNATVEEKIGLTLENGAQWTYFGVRDELVKSKPEFDVTVTIESTPKRIGAITLNGGIINLYDEDIQRTWQEIGLTDVWSDVKNNHDYVRIGDLKGNGGIFRLDLDAEIKQNSDMVFIESSSDGGQHFIEPYNMELLESVSPTNTLTFALQEPPPDNGNFISFAEKQNIYGQSLFDYELEIDSRVIENKDQIKDIHYASWETDGWDFDASKYVNGKEWFIKRVELIESAASIGMRSAGYASYDLAVSMDRRDRRLHDAVFQNEEKDGLWTRIQYGEAGAEHLYNADLTTVYVGYEKATSPDNRLGFSFGYTDGDSDFSDLKGSGELKRYEASVYDTLTFGSHYLDFVARFGQVENDFDVTNQAGTLTTSGSFDQKYAALSAEYGYNFKDEHNVFIEPQVQLQVAYLGDYDYRTERNMKVEADNDISIIGRVGLRTGKAFESADYAGELYARADVLHQFTDGQDADFSDLSHKVGVTWGDKDTWSTFGVGGYLNWKDNMSFQVDVERTAGGETTDTWLVSGRFNYLF